MLRNLLLAILISFGIATISYSQTIIECEGSLTVIIEGSESEIPLDVQGSAEQPDCDALSGNLTGNIQLTVEGGTEPYDYDWTVDGAEFTGEGAGTDFISELGTGDYAVTVTDAKGCIGTFEVSLVEPDPVVVTGVTENLDCNSASGDPDGTIDISVTGGTETGDYEYVWEALDGGLGLDVNVADQSGLTAGIYQVTVTDDLGCTGTAQFQLTEPDAILALATATDLTCHENSIGTPNGTITLNQITGGDEDYSFNWEASNGGSGIIQGEQNQSNLTAGLYDLTITDGLGCTLVAQYELLQPTEVEVDADVTQLACHADSGDPTGAIDITPSGGQGSNEGDYTYNWEASAGGSGILQGQADQTNLTAGTYNVTVTDANSCTVTAEYILTQPDPVVADGTFTSLACNADSGDADGTITMDPTGGTGAGTYQYAWTASNGGSGIVAGAASQTGLTAGTYDVIVTDANGCTDSNQFILTQPDPVVADGTFTSLACHADSGDADGTITMDPTGGTGAGTYQYAWTASNGGSGIVAGAPSQTGLTAGTYDVIVTDGNGCTDSNQFILTQPDAVVADGTFVDPGCNAASGSADGSITMDPEGGTGVGTYQYEWAASNGGSGIVAGSPIQTGLSGGTYDVTVTDANGCTDTNQFILTEPASVECSLSAPTLGANGDDLACYGDLTTITVDANGGTGAYTYTLSGTDYDGNDVNVGPQASPEFNDIPAGTYTVTTADANGCSTTCDITLTHPELLAAGTCTTDDECQVGDGAIEVEAAGGVGPYTVTWTSTTGGTLDQASQVINNSGGSVIFTGAQGNETYIFTVTDSNGCELGG